MSIKGRTINFISAYGLLVLLAFLFQTTLAFRIRILGVQPSALIALTVAAAMFLDFPKSGLVGGILGFLCDALAGGVPGLYTVTLLLLGLGAGWVSSHYLRRNFLSTLFLYTLSYAMLMALFAFGIVIIFDSTSAALYVIKKLFFEAVYSLIFLPPFFFIIHFFDRILADDE